MLIKELQEICDVIGTFLPRASRKATTKQKERNAVYYHRCREMISKYGQARGWEGSYAPDLSALALIFQ